MITRISEQITNRWIHKNVIRSEDRDIYKFGLEQFLTTIMQLLMIVLLGILFQAIMEVVILVVAFMWLRSYAGGYHASTGIGCYLLTTISIALGLSVITLSEIGNKQCLMLLIVAGLIIITLAPVETKNKPLDVIEKSIYRRKAITRWLMEVVCAVISMVMGQGMIAICIMVAHIVLGGAMIVGSIKNGL